MASVKAAKVAVAGANGKLGNTVVRHLLAEGNDITLVTRDAAATAKGFPNIKNVVQTDYQSADELGKSLAGHDTVISLLTRAIVEPQITLVNAAVAAKVPHFIPSSFGLGTRDEEARSVPFLQSKVAVEDHIVQQAEQGRITYTAIQTGPFFEWALGAGFIISSTPGKPTILMNGGDVPVGVSVFEDIGKAVAVAVRKRHNETRNRELKIKSTVITQNRLMRYRDELFPGKEWPTVPLDTAEAYSEALNAYSKGDRDPQTLRPFMLHMYYGGTHGNFKEIDNDLLELKGVDEDFVKAALKKAVEANLTTE